MNFDVDEVVDKLGRMPESIGRRGENALELCVEPCSAFRHRIYIDVKVGKSRVDLVAYLKDVRLTGDLKHAALAAFRNKEFRIYDFNPADDTLVPGKTLSAGISLSADEFDGNADELVKGIREVISAQHELWAVILGDLGMEYKGCGQSGSAAAFRPDEVIDILRTRFNWEEADFNAAENRIRFTVPAAPAWPDGLDLIAEVSPEELEMYFEQELDIEGDLEKAGMAARTEFPDVSIYFEEDYEEIYTEVAVKAEKIGDAPDRLVAEVNKILARQADLWNFIRSRIAPAAEFNRAEVAAAIRKLPYFRDAEESGRLHLVVPPSAGLGQELDVEIAVSGRNVFIDSTIRRLKLTGDLHEASREASSRFPDWDFELRWDGKDIQAGCAIKAAECGDDLVGGVLRKLEEIIGTELPRVWSYIIRGWA